MGLTFSVEIDSAGSATLVFPEKETTLELDGATLTVPLSSSKSAEAADDFPHELDVPEDEQFSDVREHQHAPEVVAEDEGNGKRAINATSSSARRAIRGGLRTSPDGRKINALPKKKMAAPARGTSETLDLDEIDMTDLLRGTGNDQLLDEIEAVVAELEIARQAREGCSAPVGRSLRNQERSTVPGEERVVLASLEAGRLPGLVPGLTKTTGKPIAEPARRSISSESTRLGDSELMGDRRGVHKSLLDDEDSRFEDFSRLEGAAGRPMSAASSRRAILPREAPPRGDHDDLDRTSQHFPPSPLPPSSQAQAEQRVQEEREEQTRLTKEREELARKEAERQRFLGEQREKKQRVENKVADAWAQAHLEAEERKKMNRRRILGMVDGGAGGAGGGGAGRGEQEEEREGRATVLTEEQSGLARLLNRTGASDVCGPRREDFAVGTRNSWGQGVC